MKFPIVVVVGLVFACLTLSCNKRPKGVLSDKEMVKLIADLETAESYLNQYSPEYPGDETRERAMQYVLQRNGVSRVDFDSTLSWYGRNIDVYNGLLDKVDKELERRQLQSSGSIEEDEGNNASNLWPYSKHFMISPNSQSNNIAFSIPAENLTPGERLNWIFRYKGQSNANVMLGVDYDSGPDAYVYETSYGSRRMELSLQTDTSRVVRRIYGSVVFPTADKEVQWIDSIMLQKLPFDSTMYYKVFSHRHLSEPQAKRKEVADSVGSAITTASPSIEDEEEMPAPKVNVPVAHPKPWLNRTAAPTGGKKLNIKKRHSSQTP